MSNNDKFSREHVKRTTTDAQQKKLTTGEYRQALRQQYERMAQHQRIIEAECYADNIH